MNILKTWTAAIAAAGIIGALVSYFLPSQKFEKVLKISLCAFFIAAFLVPLQSLKHLGLSNFSFSVTSQEAGQNDSFVQRVLINSAAESVKTQVQAVLAQKRINCRAVDVRMNIDSEGSIVINEITLHGVANKQMQKAHDIIKKKLGLEVQVMSSDG